MSAHANKAGTGLKCSCPQCVSHRTWDAVKAIAWELHNKTPYALERFATLTKDMDQALNAGVEEDGDREMRLYAEIDRLKEQLSRRATESKEGAP